MTTPLSQILYLPLPSGRLLLIDGRPVRLFDNGKLRQTLERVGGDEALRRLAAVLVEALLLNEAEAALGRKLQLGHPLKVMPNGIATAPAEPRARREESRATA